MISEEKKSNNLKIWIILIGIFILWIFIATCNSALDKASEEESKETTTEKPTGVVELNKITIPSLVEYEDDITADDEEQNITKEDLEIPSSYTTISSNNTSIINPVGSEAIVSEVIDGDTIKLSDGNKVRILGIDTPETKDPRKPVQCFGEEASKKMTEYVNGKKVILLVDLSQGDKDRYGRLLRYVYLNNTDIGAEMIKQGYAYAYLKYPVSMTDKYKEYEKQARESKIGLWAEDTCNGSTELIEPEPISTPPVQDKVDETTQEDKAIPVVPPATTTYTCDCSRTCTQITSCDEAYYQLNTCGCSIRDNDKDGIPCETLCN
ncbi:MAG: thermonuclease family protein [bacterium]